jgi:hypothetical protein
MTIGMIATKIAVSIPTVHGSTVSQDFVEPVSFDLAVWWTERTISSSQALEAYRLLSSGDASV